MDDPIWISRELVLAIHSRQLAEHGGADGVRDEGLLDSALGRARNCFAYDDPTPSIPALAAAYAYGIARNHAFVDGNKRIAFMAMMIFLLRNGVVFSPEPAHATAIIVSLAAGEVSEESLTRWIRDNWPSE